jgi:hypothetical protein
VRYEEFDTRVQAEEEIKLLEVFAYTTCILVEGRIVSGEGPEMKVYMSGGSPIPEVNTNPEIMLSFWVDTSMSSRKRKGIKPRARLKACLAIRRKARAKVKTGKRKK